MWGACRSASQNAKLAALGDASSVVENPDGTYTVACKDNRVEKDSYADIKSGNICLSQGASLVGSWEGIFGGFSVAGGSEVQNASFSVHVTMSQDSLGRTTFEVITMADAEALPPNTPSFDFSNTYDAVQDGNSLVQYCYNSTTQQMDRIDEGTISANIFQLTKNLTFADRQHPNCDQGRDNGSIRLTLNKDILTAGSMDFSFDYPGSSHPANVAATGRVWDLSAKGPLTGGFSDPSGRSRYYLTFGDSTGDRTKYPLTVGKFDPFFQHWCTVNGWALVDQDPFTIDFQIDWRTSHCGQLTGDYFDHDISDQCSAVLTLDGGSKKDLKLTCSKNILSGDYTQNW